MISASLVKELREKTGAGMLDCKKALEATNADMDLAVDWLREKGISKAMKKADRIAAEGIASILIKGNEAAIVEVNSETDFVAKNTEFTSMVEEILNVIIESDVKTVEEALNLSTENGTVQDLIVAKTAKIGEKLSLRRFEKVIKEDTDVFGEYIHMGGKIATLVLLSGANETVANDVAMQAAAMRPLYTNPSMVPDDVLEKEKSIMKEQLLNEGKPADRIENILVGKVKKYYEDVCLENQIYIKAENKETVGEYVAKNDGVILNMIRFEVGEGMEKRCENFAEEVAKQING
ncbi:MAG: translation elongation factor Ts [Bacilli bacterium]|nr:translation elongation factor Ts [Bacilli bacterium]